MTKEGMRGFAGGMIIATAIFAFFYYQVFHIPTKPTDNSGKLTSATVQSYLTKHQMVAVNKDEYANLKDQQQKSKEKQSNTSTNNKSSKTNNSQTSNNTNKDASSTSTPKVYKADITVKTGMTSQDVANLLKNEHIIDDVQKFNDYLQSHKLMKYVQIGTFHVSSDMSISQIAKVITRS